MKGLTWLSPGDPAQRTGGYLYNARMVAGLTELGVDVDVVALHGDWPWADESAENTDALAEIPSGRTVVADGLLWPGLSETARRDLCARCTVWVVVHSLADKEDAGPGAAEAARRELAALSEARGWFATSTLTATILRDRLGGAGSAPVIIPGTDPHSGRVEPDHRQLLSVGHLIPRKGHDRLLRGLAELSDLEWSLRIVGAPDRDPSWSADLGALCTELGLEARVHFTGVCDQAQLDLEYDRAGVMVHTAHFEAYGMVLTEALARGVPVISTPAGALDDIDSEAVWPVADTDLVQTLRRWLSDDEARASASRAAQSLSFPSWSEQVVALKVLLGFADTSFSTDWLKLREPFDHGARSAELVSRFSGAVAAERPRLLEIATGLGSGARFVAERFGREIDWTLLDHDDLLLNDLHKEMEAWNPKLKYQTVQHDLQDIGGLPDAIDGVTTQALLDLVSYSWLTQFADWLADHRLPLLAAISVDGRMSWSVPDEADDCVQAAFKTHQTWDRGFGPSPGVGAVDALCERLTARGYQTTQVDADWIIPEHAAQMMTFMIDGIATAALEACRTVGATPADVQGWQRRRREQVGRIGLCVGHTDMLALPGEG